MRMTREFLHGDMIAGTSTKGWKLLQAFTGFQGLIRIQFLWAGQNIQKNR